MVLADETDPPPKKRQMNVRLDPDLIDLIDQRRALRGLSRDEWVARALRYALQEQPAPSRPRSRTNR